MSIGTAATAGRRTGREERRDGRGLGVAAAVYVGSWIVGLAVGPGPAEAGAGAEAIRTHYLEAGPAAALQSLLVHGVAGVALAVLWLRLAEATRAAGRTRSALLGAGLAAAAVSLLQCVLGLVAVARAGSEPAEWSARMLSAINAADVVKLLLLAVAAAAGSVALRRAGRLTRWLLVLSIALVALLPLGALAFVVDAAVLGACLAASLVVLLLWVGSVAWACRGSARLRPGGPR